MTVYGTEDQVIIEKRSRVLRRSGVGFYSVGEAIGWKPDSVIQAGVGLHHQEIDVFLEAWPELRGNFHGFEPHPKVFESVGDSYPGSLLNVALAASTGPLTMHNRPGHVDGSSLYRPNDINGEGATFEVAGFRLDDLPWDYPYRHTLLWLDCEGGEYNALLGGLELLKQIEVVNIEMTPRLRSKDWCSPVDVHNLLVYHGFWLQWIHTQRCSHGQCDMVYVRDQVFSPIHCCSPQELERWNKLH